MMKKEIKFFSISDFDQEAVYLTDMHRQGWKLTKVIAGVIFYFEAVEPEEVVYQLDFKETDEDKEAYLQLYSDYGWECVVPNAQVMIFRKPAQADEDLTIFSDKDSKIEMLKSLFASRLLLLLVSYLSLSGVLRWQSPMGEGATEVALLVLNLIVLPVWLHLGYSFYRLRKLVKGN